MFRCAPQRLLLFLSSLLMFSLPFGAAAQPRPVTIAIDDGYPPYSYVEQDHPAGLYVELIRKAMLALPGWELRLVSRPWVRALQEAEQGRVDAVLPPYRGLGRDWIALYAGPLHREEVVLSCSAASHLGPASHWPEDFMGRRIGVMRGYLLSQALTAAVKQRQVVKQDFRNARDALAALALGEIDCYANDRLNVEQAHATALADPVWAARVPARLEPPYVLSSQQAFVGFSQRSLAQRPELAEFTRLLDAQLALLRARGELHQLLEQARATRQEP